MTSSLLTCQRNGCTAEYREEVNSETSCRHHPGQPIFHEGLKGWSCCSKRVINFDDLFTITGCKTGFHRTEEKNRNLPNYYQKPQETVQGTKTEEGLEVFQTKGSSIINKSTSYKIPVFVPKEKKEEGEEEEDPVDAKIEMGTVCLHYCCGKKFESEKTRKEECHYHKGEPIFHEGSKYWSCCSKKKNLQNSKK